MLGLSFVKNDGEPLKALSLGAAVAVDETALDNSTVLSQGVV